MKQIIRENDHCMLGDLCNKRERTWLHPWASLKWLWKTSCLAGLMVCFFDSPLVSADRYFSHVFAVSIKVSMHSIKWCHANHAITTFPLIAEVLKYKKHFHLQFSIKVFFYVSCYVEVIFQTHFSLYCVLPAIFTSSFFVVPVFCAQLSL